MSAMMQAAVFKGEGVLCLEQVPVPEIQNPDDVLVRVEAASICGSDLHVLSVPPGQYGAPGTILGHEFVGVVEQIGSGVRELSVGDRVVMEPNIHCGMCPECRNGLGNLCRNNRNTGQTRNGAFAKYCLAPERQLFLVPAGVPVRWASLAEPMACVMHGMMAVNPMPHQKVVIFGGGATGLMFLGAMRQYGVGKIALVAPRESSRETALRCGAGIALDGSAPDFEQQLEAFFGGPPDIAIDAVGAGVVFEQAVELLGPGGILLVFGQNINQKATIRPALINIKKLSIISTLATLHSFPPALDMISRGVIPMDDIITHELPLSDIHKGIELMRNKKAIKVVVYPD